MTKYHIFREAEPGEPISAITARKLESFHTRGGNNDRLNSRDYDKFEFIILPFTARDP